jgi:hypothetical protein
MKKIVTRINGHKINTRVHRMAYVSINGHVIRRNAVLGKSDPPIRIAKSQSDTHPEYASEITISGPSQLLYSPDEPIMKCGARLVLVAPAEYVKVVR